MPSDECAEEISVSHIEVRVHERRQQQPDLNNLCLMLPAEVGAEPHRVSQLVSHLEDRPPEILCELSLVPELLDWRIDMVGIEPRDQSLTLPSTVVIGHPMTFDVPDRHLKSHKLAQCGKK